MTTDRTLLELAAKAAGYELVWGKEYFIGKDKVDCTDMPYIKSKDIDDLDCYWNPLTDDGDALRLAVKLGINVPTKWEHERMERHGLDVYAATRRAIVRAAASIGESLD